MIYRTLISTAILADHLDDPQWVVVDCRFSLADTGQGRRDYEVSHIPGAVYAHLDDDLSGPVAPGQTGRHPLPDPGRLARTLGAWGIDATTQVVVYDDAGGAYAARLWWMLRWLGHDAAALLDGGWDHWQKEGRPVKGGAESSSPRSFVPRLRPELVVTAADVQAMVQDPTARVLDSRTADRYRGQNETIDPVAGHIPGALCAPYPDNLSPDGAFLPRETLRQRFEDLLAGAPPEQAAFYCGSGVSAAHNLLAMAYAGLGEGKLYVGSWSEWITDPRRPVAKGAETN